MRKLIHCNTCNPGGTNRNIWDCDTYARTRTCRCCRTTVSMRTQNKAVTAKHKALAAMFEQMLAKLTTSQGA